MMDSCCFRKKPSPDKSASDRQHSQEKMKSSRNWHVGQPPRVPKEMSTDLSEHRTSHMDEAETSHHKNTEHDILQWGTEREDVSSPDQTPEIDFSEHKDEAETSYCKTIKDAILQWRIGLKDVSLPDEVKEFASKINDALQKLRKEIKKSKLSQEVPQEKIQNIISYIYKGFKNQCGPKSIEDEEITLMEVLNHSLGHILYMTEVVSNIRTGPNLIQQALTTSKVPKTLKKGLNKYIELQIKNIYFLGKKAKWEQWENPSNDIDDLKLLLNRLNDRQKHLENPSGTESLPNDPQENNEPHHLKLWLEKLVPNIQEPDEWIQLSQE